MGWEYAIFRRKSNDLSFIRVLIDEHGGIEDLRNEMVAGAIDYRGDVDKVRVENFKDLMANAKYMLDYIGPNHPYKEYEIKGVFNAIYTPPSKRLPCVLLECVDTENGTNVYFKIGGGISGICHDNITKVSVTFVKMYITKGEEII